MADRAQIKPGDWVRIGGTDCVVVHVREVGSALGDCEVVYKPSDPANRNIVWNGDQWTFLESGDYGGYAANYARLAEYVRILKRGRWT